MMSVAAACAACGSDPSGSTAVAVAQSRKPAPVDAGVTTTAEPYLYSYMSMGKRDPFRSSIVAAESSGSSVSSSGEICDEPLCQVDLDELRLVAVVSGDANPVAMVEDRAGVGHLVRRNTKVGKQAGKVTAILRDCIVVTSFVVGPDGRAQPNRQSLCVSTEGTSLNPVLDLMNGKTRE
jgi:type IV pilus assembly protein PilP